MRNVWLTLLLVCWLLPGAASPAQQGAPNYHLIKQIHLGAVAGTDEYFDYVTVDSTARRVYLTHGTEVIVLDADTFGVVGTISGLTRCHGVLILPELGKGFVTDGGAGTVDVFDLKSLKVVAHIQAPAGTDSILYDRKSKLIFTFNGKSKNAEAIDPVKQAVVKVIGLDGGPEFPAADGNGTIYDDIEEKNEVDVIDTQTLAVKAHWPVAPAGAPVGMGMDREHRRLFSAGRGPEMLVMMDADNGRVIQSLPISAGVDACIFEPSTGLLFISTRAGKIHIFHEDSPEKLVAVATVDSQYGAKTMNIDPKTHNLFLTTADFGPAPAATPKKPDPQRSSIPGTFRVLIYGR
jgi:DNA-binding beta-propeller fold protein YncE